MVPEQSDHAPLSSSPSLNHQPTLSIHIQQDHSPFSTSSHVSEPNSPLEPNQSQTHVLTTEDIIEDTTNQLTLSSFYPKHILDLNLTHCPVNQYYQLLEDPDNPYDLVEGILVLREMADHGHAIIADYLHHRLRHYVAEYHNELCTHLESKIFISKTRVPASPNSSHSPSTPRYDYTYRRSDIAIGFKESCEDHSRTSPQSKLVTFSEEQRAPFMVVEITSTRSTRNDDLISKRDQYLSRGISEYVIIDRDKDRRKNRRKHDPSIICYIKTNSGSSSSRSQDNINYSKHEFRGDENIDVSLLRHLELNPNDIFNCQTASQWEGEQQKKQKLKNMEVAKERDDAKKERDKEREKRKRRDDQLRALGHDITDSSSSENSNTRPNRKRMK